MDDAELRDLYSLRNEYRSLRYDLGNIQWLCEELGHPERAFRSTLIAGTNGKGSVAWWLAGMVPGSGLYVSPHLERLNERISIGGSQIEDDDLRSLMGEVDNAVQRSKARFLYPPTYFERVTAIAFCYFSNRTPYVVLEVGLGGRLDATNVVTQDVSVITSIGRDHQEHLGPTLGHIAYEKAGIIKQHEPVLVGKCCDYEVISARAGNRLIRTSTPEPQVTDLGGGFYEFDLQTDVRSYAGVRPGLAGRHQLDNAVLSIRAAEALERAGWPVSESAIVASLARGEWPGRLEQVPGDPPVILDGAHNPDAAIEVARYLSTAYPHGVCLIFGVMKAKDYGPMIDCLLPHASTVIFTQARNSRSVSARDLLPMAPGALVAGTVQEALVLARHHRRGSEPVLVTGSLFLVGEARALLLKERPAEPLPAR